MSGYLMVKSIPKSANFPTFKIWKKQWCILRPCPIKKCILIIFHAVAGSQSNAQVEIPEKSAVYRIPGNPKKFTFGIYTSINSPKPLLYLAGQTETEAQLWMYRIRMMLQGKNPSEKNKLQEDCYNISLIDNDFSNLCGFRGLFGTLTVVAGGFIVSDGYFKSRNVHFSYKHISSIELLQDRDYSTDTNRIIILRTNRNFDFGEGQILIFCLHGMSMYKNLNIAIKKPDIMFKKLNKRMSRSEGAISKYIFKSKFEENTSNGGESSASTNSKWYCPLKDKNHIPEDLNLQRDILTNKNVNTSNVLDKSKSESCDNIYWEIEDNYEENIYECIPHIQNTPPPLPSRFRKHIKSVTAKECQSEVLQKNCLKTNISEVDSKSPNLLHAALDAFRTRIKSESQLPRERKFRLNSEGSGDNLSGSSSSKNPNKFFNSPVMSRIKRNTDYKIEVTNESTKCDNFKLQEINKSKHRLSKSEEYLSSVDYKDYGFHFDVKRRNFDSSVLDTEEYRNSQFIKYGFHFPLKEYKFDTSSDWHYNNSDEGVEDLSLLSPENSFIQTYPKEIVELVLKGQVDLAEKKIKQFNAEEEYVVMSPGSSAGDSRNKIAEIVESTYVRMDRF